MNRFVFSKDSSANIDVQEQMDFLSKCKGCFSSTLLNDLSLSYGKDDHDIDIILRSSYLNRSPH